MLFPDTPDDVLRAAAPPAVDESAPREVAPLESIAEPPVAGSSSLSIAQEVLSESSTLFAERGYYAVAMEDIASAANLSRATLYRYFSTKDKILAELTRLAVTEIEEHAAALPSDGPGVVGRVDARATSASTAPTAASFAPGSTAPSQSSCPTRRSSMASARSIAQSAHCSTRRHCPWAWTPRWRPRCSWPCWAG